MVWRLLAVRGEWTNRSGNSTCPRPLPCSHSEQEERCQESELCGWWWLLPWSWWLRERWLRYAAVSALGTSLRHWRFTWHGPPGDWPSLPRRRARRTRLRGHRS